MDKLVITPDGEVLMLNVAADGGGVTAPTAREAVRQSDTLSLRDETWMQGLRKGTLPWDLPSLELRYIPAPAHGNAMLGGLIVELSGNGGKARRFFPAQCLDLTLQRAITEPLQKGKLTGKDQLRFWLSCESAEAAGKAAAGIGDRTSPDTGCVTFRVRSPVWRPESARLSAYLDASEPLLADAATPPTSGKEDGKLHAPLFIPADVWGQGRRFACRDENLESAAVFTGRLMQDRESAEVFTVVDACIEARHTEKQPYSVKLTGETWSEVHRVLDRRRRRLDRPHEIIIGSVHGHPFPPATEENGQGTCPECDKRMTCAKTTAVASLDDIDWHRSVFTGQPWAVLAVWGRNARGEEVWQAYGLAGGTLVPRAIRILC